MTAYEASEWSDLFVATAGASAALAGLARLPAIGMGSGGREARGWLVGRWTSRYGGALLLAVGSLSIVAAAGGGLYWIVAAIVLAVIGAVANAWVLLVEILR